MCVRRGGEARLKRAQAGIGLCSYNPKLLEIQIISKSFQSCHVRVPGSLAENIPFFIERDVCAGRQVRLKSIATVKKGEICLDNVGYFPLYYWKGDLYAGL